MNSTKTSSMKRICLWSGPRNISTALMYSFAQRADTCVYDEPLYAHYLKRTDASEYHPGSDEILTTMENDGRVVVQMMMGEHPRPISFFKHMTHHLVDLDFGFFTDVEHMILTRDPSEMLPSYAQAIERPTLRDVGYKQHVDLIDELDRRGISYLVVDSKSILQDPQRALTVICEALGIPFDATMLTWSRGARPEDGCWAKYWYHNVHNSTGFKPYIAKTAPFPEEMLPLLEECMPYYERLVKEALCF